MWPPQRPGPRPKSIVLDFDPTDTVYWSQEGRHFSGYCQEYSLLPLWASWGHELLLAKLRPGGVDAPECNVRSDRLNVPSRNTDLAGAVPERCFPSIWKRTRGRSSHRRRREGHRQTGEWRPAACGAGMGLAAAWTSVPTWKWQREPKGLYTWTYFPPSDSNSEVRTMSPDESPLPTTPDHRGRENYSRYLTYQRYQAPSSWPYIPADPRYQVPPAAARLHTHPLDGRPQTVEDVITQGYLAMPPSFPEKGMRRCTRCGMWLDERRGGYCIYIGNVKPSDFHRGFEREWHEAAARGRRGLAARSLEGAAGRLDSGRARG